MGGGRDVIMRALVVVVGAVVVIPGVLIQPLESRAAVAWVAAVGIWTVSVGAFAGHQRDEV